MPKMHVKKSILIDKSADQVYQNLIDFHHWTSWSPWLIQEPEARVEVADGGKSYSWEGDRIGSGNMQVTKENAPESVEYDLNFLKPWKSTAKVRFELEPKDGATEVSWLMDSSMPFFLFWMKKAMTAYVGMDYERGLAMLKDYVEDGEVHSKLEFKGISSFPGCEYVGIQTSTTMGKLGADMERDFTKVSDYFCDREELVAATPFSMYHKWDVVKNQVAYTSGVPVNRIPDKLPAGMIAGSIPSTKVYTVAHTGPYGHLGNAWSTLYSMQRSKVFKLNKRVDPFETYVTDPEETDEKELVTEIHFPVK